MTKKELAQLAGYTYRRLFDIDRDLPPDKRLFVLLDNNKYDAALFVQRWVAYNVARESTGPQDLDTVKAIHEQVKTRKTELEVARLEGSLVDVDEVRRLWANIAKTVQSNMMQLPSQVAPLLLSRDSVEHIADILQTAIRERLEIIADTPLPDVGAAKEAEEEAEE